MLKHHHPHGLLVCAALVLASLAAGFGCGDSSSDLTQDAGPVLSGSPGAGNDAGALPGAGSSPMGGGVQGGSPSGAAPSGGVPGGGTPGAGSVDSGTVDSGVRDSGAALGGSDASTSPDATISGDGGASAGGCSNILPLPENLKLRGPWDVGVRTVKVGRLTVEITYPAAPGSGAGKPDNTYDIRDWLPEQEKSKVPADHSPAVTAIGGHLYRDLPIDDAHGPYPVVIFIHGTASFRIASGSTATHWASRGFVVLSADYPGLGLHDQLASTLDCDLPTNGDQDIPNDVMAQINALDSPTGDLAFLKDRVDMKRLGISGHSQGACVSATLGNLPNVQIVIPLDGSTDVVAGSSLKSVLFLSGMDDQVIGYTELGIGSIVCPLGSLTTETAYNDTAGPPKIKKRMVGIKGGGHLVPTDLCQTNAQGKNAIQEAQADGVCGIDSAVIIGLPALFDCGTIDWKAGVEAVNVATTAALEETLHCLNRDKQFASLKTDVPLIGDFRESVK